uniref:Uncharacterized protein n=1 Tax=Catagonus wagneri TaxID=51154 RepID=A0A8C3WE89_9CETA
FSHISSGSLLYSRNPAQCLKYGREYLLVENMIISEPHFICMCSSCSLMKCDLKASECQKIASLLIKSKSLKKLTLSNNPLKNEGVKVLCDAVLRPDCALESLVLLFCCLTRTGCISIGRALMLSKTLKHLDVGVNLLENLGVSILTLPLTFPTCKLQELELSGCFFTSDVCQNIALVLTNNSNLRSLELGSNDIGDKGVETLCNALKHPNCKLENIGLEECMLTSGCCGPLASVLIRSKTLKKLNLLGNDLGDEGILQLLEGLGHPDCVLEAVGVDAETRRSLLTVKKKNTRLTLIYQSWAEKKGREVSYKIGDDGDVSSPQTVPVLPRLNWHLICFHMPRKFRPKKKSTKVSKQLPQSCSA